MQVIVNKLLTSYTEVGSGSRVILFLHGWADTAKTFDGLAVELAKGNKHYKAVMLDLPGFGGTQAPPEAWGLEDYAGHIKAFLDKLNIKPDTVIGHSNGGAIAINGLAHDVFHASHLVLLASAGIRRPSVRKGVLRMLAKPAKMAIKVAPRAAQRKVRHKLYTAIGSDYLIAEHMQETFKKIVSADVTKDAVQIQIPTCLIYAANDTATPPEYGEILHGAIKGSTLHIVPETGHFLHQEQVYKTASIIKEFLA